MAKAKIKDIKASTKVPSTGVGTLTDASTGKDYSFEQTYYMELGLKVGSLIDYRTVNLTTGTMALLTAPDATFSGSIKSVNADNTTGNIAIKSGAIQFSQCYASEGGLKTGVNVSYLNATVGRAPMALCVSPL